MSKKGKFVDICTLEDLTALVNHNFQAFEKRVAKLSRKSSMLTVLAVAAVVGVYALAAENRKREEQVYQLSVRLLHQGHAKEHGELRQGEGSRRKEGRADLHALHHIRVQSRCGGCANSEGGRLLQVDEPGNAQPDDGRLSENLSPPSGAYPRSWSSPPPPSSSSTTLRSLTAPRPGWTG